MAKGRMNGAPFRMLTDAGGRADWLRDKSGAHPGYDELLAPGSTRRKRMYATSEEVRRRDQEARQARKDAETSAVLAELEKSTHIKKRARSNFWRADVSPPLKPETAESAKWRARQERRLAINAARTERREIPARPATPRISREAPRINRAVDHPPPPLVLSVPVPAERVRPTDVTYATRDGQQEFRKAIIDAYGRCAVTGCQIEDVLDAAHIIPYVDGRSNIISNGLCLRTDIHRLYDRNLIRIGGDGHVIVDAAVTCPDYRALHGRALIPPEDRQSAPCKTLLNERHKYV